MVEVGVVATAGVEASVVVVTGVVVVAVVVVVGSWTRAQVGLCDDAQDR